MKLACAFGASLILIAAAPAVAQVYPGEEVTVNPGAFGRGYLLYPGGKYGRHVGSLLQPGERSSAPVHLHMPSHHVARHVAPRTPAKVAAAAPPPRRTKTPAPPAATPSNDVGSLPEDSAARLVGGSTTGVVLAPPAKPQRATNVVPPPANTGPAAIPFTFGGRPATTPAPRRTASTTPPPANTTPPASVATGLKRQSVISFAIGESSPAAADVNAIHSLATTLAAALGAGATRVQLEAYGGPRGDKSSDSRRLSLKRALVVRELLIEDGVPSEKIDVRAMGGADDSGAADRVDVFVRV